MRRDQAGLPTGAPSWHAPPGSRNTPLVIGHRGFSSAAPENTLESFGRAQDIGCDGVELDVRLSKDGAVMVHHDRMLDRTTTGSGPIGASTLRELKALDAGRWCGEGFAGARIPTLDEVFEALHPPILMNVELKVRGFGVWALVKRAVDVIRRHRRQEHTVVASFNPLALFAARLLEPGLLRAFIWSDRHPLPLRRRWLSFLAHPQWMDPDSSSFSPEMLRRMHGKGKRVLAWDIDAGADMEGLGSLALDGVVTDYPDALLRQRSGG